jgi:CheY-like chemotaxis protein/anti-sigma regulatory factor (Ser/Thr protein kinase)
VPRGASYGGGVGLLVHDVTAERDLLRAKDELVAMVSHELASPATNLIGYAELLVADGLSDVERRDMLDTMVGEGRRLTTIIRDFLDIQRMQQGRLDVHPRPMDLTLLLKQAVGIARANKAHQIRLDLPDRLPLVHGDPDRVQQVVANLLSNAQKYTPPGRQISLVGRLVASGVEVSVTDQGLGIPDDALARLFERFYRVDSADRQHIKGTGLGLAIVKDIVEALGGQVGVESAGPGCGARFWFTLPLARPSGGRVPGHGDGSAGHSRRVLCVDDDGPTASAVVRMLRRHGHRVAVAASGEEALRQLNDAPFDVVISDLELGSGIDGLELARLVRRQLPEAHFVLASGSINFDPADVRARAVDYVLPKPYRAQDLIVAVERSA